MKQLFKNIKAFTICLLVVSFLGCEDDDTNLPEVISGFTFTLNEEIATVTFINISEEATAFEWDFGDGETSTLINPIKTYKESGTYTVTLEASNVAGASKVFEDEITIVILDPVTLPITFDSTTVDYTPTVFGGTSFEIVANPDASGSNTSTGNVGAITNGGNAFEGLFFDLGIAIDFTTDKSITMDFWSETPVDLLLKLEEGTSGDIEVVASHEGTGWEEITFDFDSDASYSKFTFFVDGPGTTTGDFFIDDITQVATAIADSGCTDTPVAAATLPLNFEGCDTFASEFNFGGGISSELAPNPAKGGINDSDFVLKVDKPAGSDFFAGIQNTFANNFDLTTTNAFKLKVYSSKANTVFRFELALNPQTDPVTGNPAPVFVTVPNANEWTEIEVVFTGLPGGPTAYNQFVIKPDNNQTDGAITDGGTYYFDDLNLAEAGGNTGGNDQGQIDDACEGSLLQDYETADNSIFGDFGGGTATIIDNPNTTVNMSAKVGQMQKFSAEPFGGTTMTLDAPADFTNGEVFSMDVYSQRVSALTFKLEGLNIEQVINTSGTGWETMTFDFTGMTSGAAVPAITLIFDNGTVGDAAGDPDAWTFLFDNLRLCDSGGNTGGNDQGQIDDACAGSILEDNETADNSIFSDFGGGTATIVDNPNTTVNMSAKVGQMQKFSAEPFGGTTMTLDAPADFTNGEVFSMDVYSQRVSALTFKLEGLNIEQVINTSGTGWETMTFDFTGNTSGAAVPSITLIFDNGTVGDAAGDPDAWTFLFDNLRLCDSGGNTGGGTGGGCTDTLVAATALPLDFEGCETFLASQNFGAGLTSELVANPFKTGINTSDFVLQVDKPAGSDFFAGVQNTFASNFDLTTTDTFKVKVYSTKANVVFRFELALNPQTDPVTGNPAPVFVTIPNANEWIEVEVTFTGLPGGPTAYNQFVIKPDNAQGDPAITADGTYYIDDIILE